jgi:hypothetical protein
VMTLLSPSSLSWIRCKRATQISLLHYSWSSVRFSGTVFKEILFVSILSDRINSKVSPRSLAMTSTVRRRTFRTRSYLVEGLIRFWSCRPPDRLTSSAAAYLRKRAFFTKKNRVIWILPHLDTLPLSFQRFWFDFSHSLDKISRPFFVQNIYSVKSLDMETRSLLHGVKMHSCKC